jgi:prolyl-tRNA synthetase
MRISQFFGKTLREIPADAETASHRLMLRAGLINQMTAGVYSYLPLALRSLRKIEVIVRDEMNRAGGQELLLPVLQPLELWQATGRDRAFGKSLFTFKDRREHELVLGPTHEEAITQLVSRYVQSYRDLPQRLYQIQTKFRDEPRPRAGLVRVREFIMKDMYSFDVDEAALDCSYIALKQAYKNIYARCGLPSLMVEADSGAIGGKDSHEFMVIAETGEDDIIHCPACQYAANAEKAQSRKKRLPPEEPAKMTPVATPGVFSIEEVSHFLNIPAERTLKVVFYMSDGQFVMAVIRGDLNVNEIKLKNTLHASELRLAVPEEAKTAGVIAGSASPVGLTGVRIIADDSVTLGQNFVAGANRPDTHLRNVNYSRDFQADAVVDIALTRAGDTCPHCQGKLLATHGIEVGHIFKLGTAFSQKLGACFNDAAGTSHPIIMGCYGIGLGRLLAAAIEQNHDENGIVWPLPIAPYQVHLCPLSLDKPDVAAAAEELYEQLTAQGLEVLFDDRIESPGVKFKDADLLGIPIRLTLSPRTLKTGSVEVKLRTEQEFTLETQVNIPDYLAKIVSSAL